MGAENFDELKVRRIRNEIHDINHSNDRVLNIDRDRVGVGNYFNDQGYAFMLQRLWERRCTEDLTRRVALI
jgi:hypothetical protein